MIRLNSCLRGKCVDSRGKRLKISAAVSAKIAKIVEELNKALYDNDMLYKVKRPYCAKDVIGWSNGVREQLPTEDFNIAVDTLNNMLKEIDYKVYDLHKSEKS